MRKNHSSPNILNIGNGNAKLAPDTLTFSLPSGWTCPGAKDCLSKVINGKIQDGKHTKFRCFSASQEVVYKTVFKSRQKNLDLIKMAKGLQAKVELINSSIFHSRRPNTKKVRIHVAGDFFSQEYFDAWMEVARLNKDLIFYAYTKSIPFYLARINELPSNFRITVSEGGRFDNLIQETMKRAIVVFSEKEAKERGLKLDHDDSRAYSKSKKDFGLLIHGVQPKGTEAAKAIQGLKRQGKMGYSR